LRRLYAAGVAVQEIGQRVGRSADAVSARRRTLRLAPRPRARPWSDREDDLLRAAAAAGLPAAAVAVHLRRPADQVRRRRRSLTGAQPAPLRYTAAEDAAIVAGWTPGADIGTLAGRLARSPGAVRLRAQALGLHHPAARPRWRPHEDAALRDGYALGLTCAQIALEIGVRTPAAVAARAAKLGLGTYGRRWTAREDELLRSFVREGVDAERAAQLLSRTPEALRRRAHVLDVAPPRSGRARRGGRQWTQAEDELLAVHRERNPAELAQQLERSSEAVTRRMRALGVRETSKGSPHHPVRARGGLTPGQRAVIARELDAGGPRRQLALARRLGVRPSVVRRFADGLLSTEAEVP
jgi:hypothetical protein